MLVHMLCVHMMLDVFEKVLVVMYVFVHVLSLSPYTYAVYCAYFPPPSLPPSLLRLVADLSRITYLYCMYVLSLGEASNVHSEGVGGSGWVGSARKGGGGVGHVR